MSISSNFLLDELTCSEGRLTLGSVNQAAQCKAVVRSNVVNVSFATQAAIIIAHQAHYTFSFFCGLSFSAPANTAGILTGFAWNDVRRVSKPSGQQRLTNRHVGLRVGYLHYKSFYITATLIHGFCFCSTVITTLTIHYFFILFSNLETFFFLFLSSIDIWDSFRLISRLYLDC